MYWEYVLRVYINWMYNNYYLFLSPLGRAATIKTLENHSLAAAVICV